MILRRAEPDEYDAVGELTVAAYRATGSYDAEAGYLDQLRDAGRRAREAELVVAVDRASHALLGTVTFCQYGSQWCEIARPGEAEFRMLAVAPGAQGSGVGTTLARHCVDRARERQCTALVLCVLEGNSAIRIYQRMGFLPDPARDWSPAPGLQLRAFSLDLEPKA